MGCESAVNLSWNDKTVEIWTVSAQSARFTCSVPVSRLCQQSWAARLNVESRFAEGNSCMRRVRLNMYCMHLYCLYVLKIELIPKVVCFDVFWHTVLTFMSFRQKNISCNLFLKAWPWQSNVKLFFSNWQTYKSSLKPHVLFAQLLSASCTCSHTPPTVRKCYRQLRRHLFLFFSPQQRKGGPTRLTLPSKSTVRFIRRR